MRKASAVCLDLIPLSSRERTCDGCVSSETKAVNYGCQRSANRLHLGFIGLGGMIVSSGSGVCPHMQPGNQSMAHSQTRGD